MMIAKLRSNIWWWFTLHWPFLPVWFINWREGMLDGFLYRRLDAYKACRYLVQELMREGSPAGQGHRIAVEGADWDIIVRPSKPEDVYDGSSLSSFCS